MFKRIFIDSSCKCIEPSLAGVVNGSAEGLLKLCFVIQSITCPFIVSVSWLISPREASSVDKGFCKDIRYCPADSKCVSSIYLATLFDIHRPHKYVHNLIMEMAVSFCVKYM